MSLSPQATLMALTPSWRTPSCRRNLTASAVPGTIFSWVFASVVLFVFGSGLIAVGQEKEREPNEPVAGVVEVEPAVVYVKDKDGALVPLYRSIPYERLMEWWKAEGRGAVDKPPAYAVEKLTVQGDVRERLAELTLEFTIVVREAGWSPIPLKLHGLSPRGPAVYEGPTEAILRHEEALGGMALWIRAAEKSTHKFRMTAVASVAGTPDERKMQFELPRANEASAVLRFASAARDAALVSGEGVLTSANENGRVVAQVLGPSGRVAIAWKDAPASNASSRAAVDVGCDVVWKIESPQSASADASLAIRSLGATVKTLYVRLPPESRWVSTTQNAWRGARVSLGELPADVAPFAAGAGDSTEFVRLDLDAETGDWPAELRLGILAKPTTANAAEFALGGFDVLGAMRQRGSVEVSGAPGLSIRCRADESVARRDSTTSGDGRSSIAFRFGSQPFQLSAAASPQTARVVCEPGYSVAIEMGRVVLTADYRFRARGRRDAPIPLRLNGWRIESTTPPEALLAGEDGDPVELAEEARLRLGADAETTIRLQATLPFDPSTNRVEFAVPTLDDVATRPARWQIRAADNLLVEPLESELHGLTRESRGARRPEANESSWRESGVSDAPRFAATVRTAERRMVMARSVALRIGAEGVDVEETWEGRVSFAPLEEMTLALPDGAGEPIASVAGQGVEVANLPSEGPRRVRVVFGKSLTGEAKLQFSYRRTWDETARRALAQGDSARLTLDLLRPTIEGEVKWTSQQGSITWDAALTTTFVGRTASADALERRQLVARPEDLRDEPATLEVRALADALASRTVVAKAWMQTWLTSLARRDRIVWRFTSGRSSVALPFAPTDYDQIEVALDGAPVAPIVDADGTARVPLTGSTGDRAHLLEVWLLGPRRTESRSWLGATFATPLALDGEEPRRAYWHVSPASGEIALATPTGFVAEMTGSWPRWLVATQARVTPAAAERWIGVASEPDAAAGAMVLAFSSSSPPEAVRVAFAPARLLFAAVAALALAIGTLVMRSQRRIQTLLLALGCLLALILIGDSPAAGLVASATAIGVGLVFLMSAISRWLGLSNETAPATASPIGASVGPRSGRAPSPPPRESGSTRLGAPSPALMSAIVTEDQP